MKSLYFQLYPDEFKFCTGIGVQTEYKHDVHVCESNFWLSSARSRSGNNLLPYIFLGFDKDVFARSQQQKLFCRVKEKVAKKRFLNVENPRCRMLSSSSVELERDSGYASLFRTACTQPTQITDDCVCIL
jgi:hypothetical protein